MTWIRTLALLSSLLLPVTGMAYDLQFGEHDYGKLDALAKGMVVLHGNDNGYDPNSGAAYLFKLKYLTPDISGFKAAAGLYVNGDLFGLTDWESEKVARGMFVDDEGDDTAQLGELYLQFKRTWFNAFGGRKLLATPLTTISYSTIPNLYTAFGLGVEPLPKLDLAITHITEMSFGARAMTDFGLIGEGTGSAGAAVKPSTIGQAEFHSISKIALGEDAPGTDGITVLSAVYTGVENARCQVWDYYAYDIVNSLYLDAGYKMPLGKVHLDLGLQYLRQDDLGDELAGMVDFSLLGVKAGLSGKNWSLEGAYNTSFGDTAMFNAWGGDPAYTSSIFSRNAYRREVDAWGISGKYRIIKGLTFLASYFDYGQSDSLGAVGGVGQDLVAIDDAVELDLSLVYRPPQVKGLMLKTFYAQRTSEYNGSNGYDLTQDQWRVIVAYGF